MKKATALLTLSFLLAFVFSLSAKPAPGPHMKCRLDAPVGKRASVQTTHIRKKVVKTKVHKPAPAKPQKVKQAKAPKVKKEKVQKVETRKAPKQKTEKPAKQHASNPPKSSGHKQYKSKSRSRQVQSVF